MRVAHGTTAIEFYDSWENPGNSDSGECTKTSDRPPAWIRSNPRKRAEGNTYVVSAELNTVEYREVAPSDIPDVRALILGVIDSSVADTSENKRRFAEGVERNLQAVVARSTDSVHLCCTAGGRIVGVVLVRDFWNLCHLFVAAEYQGRGIGRSLLQLAVQACRESSGVAELQLKSTRNAIGFYEHMGFEPVTDAPLPFRGISFRRRLR